MIPLSRSLLLVALIFSCTAISAFAQKRYCEIPPPSPFHHSALIVTRYDKPTRRMKSVLEHPVSLAHGADALYLSASFFFSDPKLHVRPTLEVAFVSVSKEAKYRASHDLVILADGRRVPFVGAAQYQAGKNESGLVQETIRATLTYDTLFDLIQAKRVTTEMGSTQFELTTNHLESLREMASLMVPQERNMILASRLGSRPRQATTH
jgi:hypothetical protein